MSHQQRARGSNNRGSNDRGGRGRGGRGRGYSPSSPRTPQTPSDDVKPTTPAVNNNTPAQPSKSTTQAPTTNPTPQPQQPTPAPTPAQPATNVEKPVAQKPTTSLTTKESIAADIKRTTSAPPTMQKVETLKPAPAYVPQNTTTTATHTYKPSGAVFYPSPMPANVQAGFTPSNTYVPTYNPYGYPSSIQGLAKSTVTAPINQGAPAQAPAPQKPQRKGLVILNPKTGTDVITGEKVAEPSTIQAKKPVSATDPEKKETPAPEIKLAEPVKEEVKQDKPEEKAPEPVKEEPKKEEPKQEEPKKEEPKPVTPEEKAELPRNESLESIPTSEQDEEEGEDEGEDGEGEDEEEEEDEEDQLPFGENEKRVLSKDFLLKYKDKPTDASSVQDMLRVKFPNLFVLTASSTPRLPQPKGGKSFRGNNKPRRVETRMPKGGKGKKPPPKQKWAATANTNDPYAATYAEVTDILNKLTPEMYDKLVNNFIEKVKVPNSEVLTKVIEQIFEKAVREPNFSHIYSRLCSDLSQKLKDVEATNANEFRKILLTRCQSEFEDEKKIPEGYDTWTDDQKYEHKVKERKRNLGTTVFIGELYKKAMISEKIIHSVINDLLHSQDKSNPEPEELETLSKLLSTIGPQLDTDKNRAIMNGYVQKIKLLSQSKDFQSRIRFMLLDVLELRDNSWQPKIKKGEAKTIKEVREDAEKERLEMEKKTKQFSQNNRDSGYRKNKSRDKYSKEKKEYKIQSSGTPTTLGPSNNKQGSDGSKGWETKKKVDSSVNTKNSFDILNEEEEPEAEEEKVETEVLSGEVLEKRCAAIIADYLDSSDSAECVKDIKSVNAEKQQNIVQHILFAVASKINDNNSENMSALLKHIVNDSLFTSETVIAGMKDLFNYTVDKELIMESPQKYKNVGEVFGRMFALKVCALDDFAIIFDASLEQQGSINVTEFIACIYNGAKKQDASSIDAKTIADAKLNVLQYIDPTKPLVVGKYTKAMSSLNTVDVITFIIDAIGAKKSASDILSWLSAQKFDKKEAIEKVFSALITGIELNSTYARGGPSDTSLVDQYATVFSNYPKAQQQLLAALATYGAKSKFDKAVPENLVKTLISKKILSNDDIEVYKKNKDANKDFVKKI